jgi:hypothetical protein
LKESTCLLSTVWAKVFFFVSLAEKNFKFLLNAFSAKQQKIGLVSGDLTADDFLFSNTEPFRLIKRLIFFLNFFEIFEFFFCIILFK